MSSPRSEDVGNDMDSARRTLRQVQSDPEVQRQRQAIQDGEAQVLWLAGGPRSVSPRTVEYGPVQKSPRTPTRTSPTTAARGMLSPPVSRDLSDDAAVAVSGSRGSGHNLNGLDEPVSGGGVGLADQPTPEVPPPSGGQGTDGGAQGDYGTGRTRQSTRHEKFEQNVKKCFCINFQGEPCREGDTELGDFKGNLECMGVVFPGPGF